MRNTLLTTEQAFVLCGTLVSTGPVECYNAAKEQSLLTDEQAIELCRCAATLAPVNCFSQLQRDLLLGTDEMIRLCNARALNGLDANCRMLFWPAPVPPSTVAPSR